MIKLFKSCMPVEPILERLRPVLASGWYGRGKVVEEFEEAIAPWTKQKYFVATSSCTAALHLALHVLGIGKGDIVATTPITFVSTNAAILYVGATPLFVDVDEGGLLDLQKAQAAVDNYYPNPRAAMIVHLGGRPALPPRGVPVIEDCAHAFGSNLLPTNNLRCWSFSAVKNLPIGSGGGISTNDQDVAARLRCLRWMGIDRDTATRQVAGHQWEYEVPELGWNYCMTDVQAAIGLAMLPFLAEQNQRRRAIARQYAWMRLGAYDGRSCCHFLPTFVRARDALIAKLQEAGIESGVHYKPNYLYAPFLTSPRWGVLDNAKNYGEHEITLPMHPDLTDRDVERIIAVVQEHEHSLRE